MPIYEYECLSCGHRFESLQWISERDPACPHCRTEVRRRISAPAVHGEAARGREAAMRSLRRESARGCCCGAHGHRAPGSGS